MKTSSLAILLGLAVLTGCVERRPDADSKPAVTTEAPAPAVVPTAAAPAVSATPAPTAPAVVALDVSDYDLNDFVFSSPIKNGPIFPAGTRILGRPTYMAHNTQVAVQFDKGNAAPFQVLFETADGAVHILRLTAKPIPGAIYKIS